MIDFILSQLEQIMQMARDNYGVNPIIFLILYLICVPIFYYSLMRTLRSLAQKSVTEAMVWSAIFLATIVTPFVYVIFFGRNIPWWVYGVIALLIAQGVGSFVLKLRSKPANTVKEQIKDQ